MNKKKGISAVVATVLIILITVAAVTIIWAAVIPMIKTQLEEGTVCLNANSALMVENKGYTCFNDGVDIDVQVSHGAKNVSLVGIQFLISEAGDTTSVEVTSNLPTPNGEKVITVIYAGTPDSVAIAPIVAIGNSEITCEASIPVVLEAC